MGKDKYLVDSNIVIYLGNGLITEKTHKIVEDILVDFNISILTKIEVLGFKNISKDQILLFQKLFDSAIIFPIDNDISNETIQLRRKHKIKLPDAIIAATAICNDLILVTANSNDFKSIENLMIINPLQTL